MAQILSDNMRNDQAYEARGVVAKHGRMGHYQSGILKVPVFKFMTLDRGNNEFMPVEFVMPAPVIEDKGEVILDVGKLQEGDIVVNPGLVYRKTRWNDGLMAAHIKALQTYRPKTIMVADKADEPAFDLGTLDHTSDQVTKQ